MAVGHKAYGAPLERQPGHTTVRTAGVERSRIRPDVERVRKAKCNALYTVTSFRYF
jgi:hypothetical protein